MKNFIYVMAIGMSALLLASPLAADYFSPSNSCHKPYKPFQFSDQWEVDRFMSEVEQYRRCIEDFAEEQYDEAENHRRAAEEAIEEWNWFVQYELN